MTAIIQIHEMSAIDSGVDKTNGTVRFKKADNPAVDTNDPIPIPSAGNEYSYTKTLRAYMGAQRQRMCPASFIPASPSPRGSWLKNLPEPAGQGSFTFIALKLIQRAFGWIIRPEMCWLPRKITNIICEYSTGYKPVASTD
jgi:hypothetical protein